LGTEYYKAKLAKKYLDRQPYSVSFGLKKLFTILVQRSPYHESSPGTPLLIAKNQTLLATSPHNRLTYLFHRIHFVDISKYSKLRLQFHNQNFQKVESTLSGFNYTPLLKHLPTKGVVIDLFYDGSLTPSKKYIP